MDELDYDKCLLFTCRALHYFTDKTLLSKDAAGNPIPAAGAETVAIVKLLKDVDKDDQDFGLHALAFIRDSLVDDCKDEGFNLALKNSDLLDSDVIFNIKSLAKWINANATPIN
jgi:hypothetical protein